VGEPTSEKKLGDTIKIGRRGSISFNLEVEGVQGHIAYPDLAKNPIPELAKLIFILSGLKLDNGNESFAPSSLQVVKLEAENTAENVIPKTANCFFNIRFNNTYTGQVLAKKIKEIITQNTSFKFKLSYKISGEAFLTAKAEFAEVVARSVEENTGLKPNFSTSGGTSDARFIKNYAKEVLELGVLNQTAHKIDECINIKDIDILKNIYKTVIINYLK
jgi:succinyl-diaminopimelate desuccinylase